MSNEDGIMEVKGMVMLKKTEDGECDCFSLLSQVLRRCHNLIVLQSQIKSDIFLIQTQSQINNSFGI